jgi:hypothetical protein
MLTTLRASRYELEPQNFAARLTVCYVQSACVCVDNADTAIVQTGRCPMPRSWPNSDQLFIYMNLSSLDAPSPASP